MLQFSAISALEKIDAQDCIIRGVVVMEVGEAKGHGVRLDTETLDGFMRLTANRADGIKVRFGNDHKAGVEDTNGVLRNFRLENGGKVRADLHLLKSDDRNVKLLEMAATMPNEFGLSVVADAEREKDGKTFKSPLRFTQLDCVDIVSNPAATKGLFFSQHNNDTTMLKEFAVMLGLPETATEQEVKVALEAKCKTEPKKEEKKELEADDEEKGKQGKKLEALESQLVELAAKQKAQDEAVAASQAAAHKAEIENLKLEASKDGKVIPLSDEDLLKLSATAVKEMISKLSKSQIKMSRGNIVPVNAEGKELAKGTPEFKAYLKAKQAENALVLGQKMLAQIKL